MPHPTNIKSRTKSRVLEVSFDDGSVFELPYEYLRVFSPSAEVRGHGPGQEQLQLGKHEVTITQVEPVGNYAVKLVFDDGHNTGLYTWAYLYELGRDRPQKWQSYLDRLKELGIAYPTVLPKKPAGAFSLKPPPR
ncbi:gamma-butyrobetaine hydroxylase-like domain-containing protein [Steroidobacter flavus]|uniref:Gamma-butyrobetaine hydroxylase-like domain-containing protein n=1 Tax=Steroidobacter flavus TaxID=1842136 RepID=A0ABV8SST3_9GAMM